MLCMSLASSLSWNAYGNTLFGQFPRLFGEVLLRLPQFTFYDPMMPDFVSAAVSKSRQNTRSMYFDYPILSYAISHTDDNGNCVHIANRIVLRVR
jgi:hypothetical protein